MKKILIIIFTIVLLISCTGGINYRMPVKKGDIRKTYTNEYVLTEVCTGTNGLGSTWKRYQLKRLIRYH